MRGEKKVIKIVIAAFLVVILLSVTSQATSIQIYQLGCKRPILPPPIEKTSIDPKPKIQKTVIIYLTKADNNANITIPLGAKINLTLKNYGDGGYQWIIKKYNPAIIKLETVLHWGASGIPGDFGKDTWIFKAIGVGGTLLELKCYQPWPGGNPGWTFKVFINVS